MKDLHSYWAYLVLVILAIAVINAVIGLTQKKQFTKKDFLLGLFTLIAAHTQLLIGLGWYFMSPWYKSMKVNGMGTAMKDSAIRLLTVEHPLIMLAAIVLVTIGWSKHKKQTTDTAKFKSFAVFYGIAFLLVLSRIPWGNWFA